MKQLSIVFLLFCFIQSSYSQSTTPGEGVWTNYDFVPGHQVLAFHDFEATYVGNFPDRIEYKDGDMEVVQLADENQVLRTKNAGRFVVKTPDQLPEKFTVEFRVSATDKRAKVMMYSPEEKAPIKSPGKLLAALVEPAAVGLTVGKYTDGPKATQKLDEEGLLNRWRNVRIAVDGKYWKMYIDEKRVANIPRVDFPRSGGLAFFLSVYPYDDGDVYIDDIRIAAGGRSMLYDDIVSKGLAITHGILFDVDSAVLRPESTPTLLDLARMLKEHEELSLRIEGHTDNTGSDDHNLALSKKRADSVRAWLVQHHGVDESRLTTDGLGATKPVAPNETAEGRQENRRVELHRL